MNIPQELNQKLKDYWDSLPQGDGKQLLKNYGLFGDFKEKLLEPWIEAEVAKVVVYEGPTPIPRDIREAANRLYAKVFKEHSDDIEAEIAATIAMKRLFNARMASTQAKEARAESAAAFRAHAMTIAAPAAKDKVADAARLKVIEERRLKGISQTDLALGIGVTVGMVSHWETGHRAIPIERIEQIAALFQKPVAYFTGTTV
jgi:DNA-binding transcriptional regulator YiaG